MLKVEQGNAGLWYVTSDVIPGLLVAGETQKSALEQVGQALADIQAAMDAAGSSAGAPAPKDHQPLVLEWRDGPPPKPWSDEWFIAVTTLGDRVVLTALPEEYTYDFKTADETYFKTDKIRRWMQFPDSEFIAPAAGEAGPALESMRGDPLQAVYSAIHNFVPRDEVLRPRDGRSIGQIVGLDGEDRIALSRAVITALQEAGR